MRLPVFSAVKISQLLCAVYILIMTLAYPVELEDAFNGKVTGQKVPENITKTMILMKSTFCPIVAEGAYQKLFLIVSRISAFSMYPTMILVFLTKCKATLRFITKTPLSMYMINDSHELHNYCGKYIAVVVWIHAVFHILRWYDQGNESLLWKHRTGLSGLVVLVITPLIVYPMVYFKKQISYEIRKGLHCLFYVFAVGMCFHVPTSGIPNGGFIAYVLGLCICLYSLDSAYVTLFMTEKIETTSFQVLSSGVLMSMDVSESFHKRGEQGGFVYVCVPWVDRNQWHAFSLFEHPKEPKRRQVFMLNSGDWTRAVHKALQRDTVRPVWVQGPFISPYSQAEAYDNQILVASGIGITPALSVIRAHKYSRRSNLIWAVRDQAMLEFFLERLYLDHNGWNLIFYTGKANINPALERMNTNVRVIYGRPNLKCIVPNIIYGVESSIDLPENDNKSKIFPERDLVMGKIHELELDGRDEFEKIVDLTTFANRRGFLLTELINDLENRRANIPNSTADVYINNSAYDLGVLEISEEDNGSNRTMDSSPGAVNDSPSIASAGGSTNTSSLGRGLLSLRRVFTPKLTPSQTSFQDSSNFIPWEQNDEAVVFVKGLDKKTVLSTWGILYCGGNENVGCVLKRISAEYHVSLNIETFAW